MAKEFSRTRRLGEQIRRDLSLLIRQEIDDRRAAMVSITLVEVARDLSHAKVYVTYIGERDERKEMLAMLNAAAGVLRQQLGRGLHIRTVPRLAFEYDESIERGSDLDALIRKAVAEDQARHRDDDTESDD
ncbi:30S ribosome-binding factor RbfA [Plasticicumulans acidivorans]|uniref:Ribosome-binding factor A n=1 Tax=Plasticicumulans acidivorans TaxID=886464 RepID=A0A317MRZ6_9GAMM|nr:30S ribosome-binding factor RbfA [Plasticicumulans acidivorans]PWV59254.1 ribosome-binding factor A [Plasticicumulans acidivorans]